jgi:hypothetical protein
METPADFIATGEFNSGTFTVTPHTPRAVELFCEMFGLGDLAPVSVEMPKTKYSDFAVFVSRKGMVAQ